MIVKTYFDPITGDESDKPIGVQKFKKGMSFSIPSSVNFKDSIRDYVILEHVADSDLMSVSINILIDWHHKQTPKKCLQLANQLNTCIFEFMSKKLPNDINIGVETMESTCGVCVSIPDHSSCPLLQTEVIAEMLLKEIIKVLVQCKKCGFIVDGSTGYCPECGAELIFIDS